jgi:hypothetical protein
LPIIPVQHLRLEFEVNALAKCFDDAFGVVKKVVCIDYANLNSSFVGIGRIVVIGWAVCLVSVSAVVCVVYMTRSDVACLPQIIEHSTNLVVPSLEWVEVIEASELGEGRDGAAVVRWDAGVRVANQEREVKFGEHFGRDDGWVVGLGFGVIRCWPILMGRMSAVRTV